MGPMEGHRGPSVHPGGREIGPEGPRVRDSTVVPAKLAPRVCSDPRGLPSPASLWAPRSIKAPAPS
eukprot:6109658-Pyramimonas_sp.AAC.1